MEQPTWRSMQSSYSCKMFFGGPSPDFQAPGRWSIKHMTFVLLCQCCFMWRTNILFFFPSPCQPWRAPRSRTPRALPSWRRSPKENPCSSWAPSLLTGVRNLWLLAVTVCQRRMCWKSQSQRPRSSSPTWASGIPMLSSTSPSGFSSAFALCSLTNTFCPCWKESPACLVRCFSSIPGRDWFILLEMELQKLPEVLDNAAGHRGGVVGVSVQG